MTKILKFESIRTHDVRIVDLRQALAEIYKGKYREQIQTQPKETLPLYVFPAAYGTARNKSAITEGSGIAVLDFDDVPDTAELKSLLAAEKWTMAAFCSPSGTGVKALIKIPVVYSDEEYKLFWMAIEMRYKNHHKIDKSGKDISRACFVSYDPNIYVNLDCELWNQQFIPPPPPPVKEYVGSGVEMEAVTRAVNRFLTSTEKHKSLLAAARTVGGYVASGAISRELGLQALEDAVRSREHEYRHPVEHALRTMMAGFNYGMTEPLVPVTKELPKPVYGQPENKVQSWDGWVIKSLDEWLDDYIEEKKPEENPLTLGIPSFDDAMRCKYRGKLGMIIGYGGTKKSFFTKTVSVMNALNGHMTLYSQMEMGMTTQIDRLLNVFSDERDFLWKLEETEKRERGSVKRWLDSNIRGTELAKRMLISESQNLQAVDFQNMLEYVKENYGQQVDVLCIDGLSMMGGTGDETQLYSRHTKELKELAKHHNILVLLIAHCSRGASEHQRNIRRYVRGSEKILDNCDFDIAFSKIADPYEYNKEDIPYIPNMGYMRLYDKRGSGGRVDRLFELDSKLQIIESAIPVNQYEPAKESKNGTQGSMSF